LARDIDCNYPYNHIKGWCSNTEDMNVAFNLAGFATSRALHQLRKEHAEAVQSSVTQGKPLPAGGWLIHIDPDELLYPSAGGGSSSFSMVTELCRAPAEVPSIR
jgi:hypothetical protein